MYFEFTPLQNNIACISRQGTRARPGCETIGGWTGRDPARWSEVAAMACRLKPVRPSEKFEKHARPAVPDQAAPAWLPNQAAEVSRSCIAQDLGELLRHRDRSPGIRGK